MSKPFSPANEYLADFNAALQVGLGNRSRILTEVEEHLHEATMAHWTAMLKERERTDLDARRSDEELWVEAQRRAVAAFGSPEEVAASFESGLLGALDRRVAIATQRLDMWLAHPFRGIALRVAFALTAYLIVSALAALFHARWPLAGVAQSVLLLGMAWALGRSLQAYMLRRRPERGFRARLRSGIPRGPFGRSFTPLQIGYLTYFLLGGAASILPGSLYGNTPSARALPHLCLALLVLAAVLLTERLAARAARGYPGETSAQRKRAWRAAHPWPAVLLRISPLPLFLLALLSLSSTFPGSRLAVGVLFVSVTMLVAVGMRLAQNADEKDIFDWRLRHSN